MRRILWAIGLVIEKNSFTAEDAEDALAQRPLTILIMPSRRAT